MDFLYSMFMAPVPAWLLWLYVGASIVVAWFGCRAFESNARLAEEALQQTDRDRMTMVSTDEWRKAERYWQAVRELWLAEVATVHRSSDRGR